MSLSQGQELAAIDFASIIGGPLTAVITAQAQAAHVTTSFIQNIAFEQAQGSASQVKLKTVSFDFSQILGQQSQFPGVTADALSIKVPLLTLLPIPFIRIDNMTIDLNVSLKSHTATTISNDFVFSSSTSESESGFFGFGPSVSFQASVTDRNTFQNEQVIDDTYSLHVTVHAVQDQMPGGMSQILNIFGNVIQTQGALIQSVVTAQVQAIQAKLNTNSNPSPGPSPGPAPH
ncbi:DUF2589 domain-containing protein [Microbacteriaceae bacterium K1510]|nr:DUF2589 domain-containing protein [Microbacteriaceae bacterium K1510]